MSRGPQALHRPLQVSLAILVATGLLALWGGVAVSSPPGGPDTITICHASDSDTNPYNLEHPSRTADAGGHAGHTGPVWHLGLKSDGIAWGDIIPPFDYVGGHFPGLNWDTIGQAFFANDCELVVSVSLVKTNNADGLAGYHTSEVADTVGASVPFKGVITNTGDVAVTFDSLVDKVGATVVAFSCNPALGSSIAVGGTATCLFTVANYSPADGGSKTNTLTVVVHEGSAATAENTHNTATAHDSSTVTTTLPPRPDLSLTVVKTNNADGVAGYNPTETSPGPGQDVPYRVVITNTSDVTVALDSIGDVVGAAASVPVTCDVALPATLASGASFTCDFTLVGSSPAYDGSVTDTVTVNGHEPGYTNNTVSQHGSSTVNTGSAPPVLTPDLSIDKSVPPGAVLPGASLTYTLAVHNDGDGTASSVIVDDAIPANTTRSSISAPGWTCTGAAVHCVLNAPLAAGGDASLTVTVALDANYTASTVSNTATVGPTDATPDDNTDTVHTDVTHTPDLSITKTGPQSAVLPGANATYTLAVHNDGDAVANSVVVDDAIPAHTTRSSISATGWTCTGDAVHCTLDSPLAIGGDASLTVTITLDANYAGATVSNTATVGPTDATPDDNTDTAVTGVIHTPDLSIVKSGPQGSLKAGDSAAYTLTVTNDGDADANSVVVDDALPANTTRSSISAAGWTCTGAAVHCTLDTSLAPGETASLTVTLKLADDYAAASVSNTATVGPTDATPDDNTSTVVTDVTHSPDLSVVKTGPANVNAGNNLTWSITVTNDGDADASSVVVTDTLPAGVTSPVVVSTGWTCTGTTDLSCTLDTSLAPGSSASLTITVTIPETWTAATVNNTAVVGPTDATPDDNTSTATSTVTLFSGGGGSVVPPVKPVVKPVVKPAAGGGQLAFTGAPLVGWLVEATALLVLGLSLVLLGRGKRTSWSNR